MARLDRRRRRRPGPQHPFDLAHLRVELTLVDLDAERLRDDLRDDPAERLAAAKKMLDQGLISQSDFEAKKKEILTAV